MNLKERINTIKKYLPKMTKMVGIPNEYSWNFQNNSGSTIITYKLGKLYNEITYENKISFLGIIIVHESFYIRSNDPLLPYEQWNELSELFSTLIRIGVTYEE